MNERTISRDCKETKKKIKSDKGLASRIYKEHLQLKNINNPIKNNIHFSKEISPSSQGWACCQEVLTGLIQEEPFKRSVGRRQDGRGVGDPISTGLLNLAGYPSNHFEHP